MKRIARVLAWLYPRQWRDPYGRELDALLEDAPLRGSDIFDLLREALLMQFQFPNAWARLGLFAAAGAIAGVGLAYAVKPDYLARADAQFFFKSENDRNAYMQQLLSRRVLAEVILGENLFVEARQRLPLEDMIYNVHRMIRMQSDGASYRLEVLTSDPNAGTRIAQKLGFSENTGEPVPVRPFLPWYSASGFGIGLVGFAVNWLFKKRARKSDGSVLF